MDMLNQQPVAKIVMSKTTAASLKNVMIKVLEKLEKDLKSISKHAKVIDAGLQPEKAIGKDFPKDVREMDSRGPQPLTIVVIAIIVILLLILLLVYLKRKSGQKVTGKLEYWKDGGRRKKEKVFVISQYSIIPLFHHSSFFKKEVFRSVTKTKKDIFITMITTFGVTSNTHSCDIVTNSLTLDCLF
jgi:hypothetical protein